MRVARAKPRAAAFWRKEARNGNTGFQGYGDATRPLAGNRRRTLTIAGFRARTTAIDRQNGDPGMDRMAREMLRTGHAAYVTGHASRLTAHQAPSTVQETTLTADDARSTGDGSRSTGQGSRAADADAILTKTASRPTAPASFRTRHDRTIGVPAAGSVIPDQKAGNPERNVRIAEAEVSIAETTMCIAARTTWIAAREMRTAAPQMRVSETQRSLSEAHPSEPARATRFSGSGAGVCARKARLTESPARNFAPA